MGPRGLIEVLLRMCVEFVQLPGLKDFMGTSGVQGLSFWALGEGLTTSSSWLVPLGCLKPKP